jgi:hypothetical protein
MKNLRSTLYLALAVAVCGTYPMSAISWGSKKTKDVVVDDCRPKALTENVTFTIGALSLAAAAAVAWYTYPTHLSAAELGEAVKKAIKDFNVPGADDAAKEAAAKYGLEASMAVGKLFNDRNVTSVSDKAVLATSAASVLACTMYALKKAAYAMGLTNDLAVQPIVTEKQLPELPVKSMTPVAVPVVAPDIQHVQQPEGQNQVFETQP